LRNEALCLAPRPNCNPQSGSQRALLASLAAALRRQSGRTQNPPQTHVGMRCKPPCRLAPHCPACSVPSPSRPSPSGRYAALTEQAPAIRPTARNYLQPRPAEVFRLSRACPEKPEINDYFQNGIASKFGLSSIKKGTNHDRHQHRPSGPAPDRRCRLCLLRPARKGEACGQENREPGPQKVMPRPGDGAHAHLPRVIAAEGRIAGCAAIVLQRRCSLVARNDLPSCTCAAENRV
jgi:hypothetical protein